MGGTFSPLNFFMYIRYLFILFSVFLSSVQSVYADSYYEDYASASDACVATGHRCFGRDYGGCWLSVRDLDAGVNYFYPRFESPCLASEPCIAEYESNTDINCDPTACIWALDVQSAGPGSASAFSSSADCHESIVITVVPDNDLVTWEMLGCDADTCQVAGDSILVTNGSAETVTVTILFTGPSIDPNDPDHPCNKDTDGDGVLDYLDVTNDYPNNTSRYIEVEASDKLIDGGSAPSERVYTKYMVLYSDGSSAKTAYLEIGQRPDDFLTNDYNETFCNPNTSNCTEFTAGQIADMYPCDGPDLLIKKSLPSEGEQETDPSNIKDDGEIPGTDTGIEDNGLLEIIANNTGKTVGNTAETAKSAINIEGQLETMNEKLGDGITVVIDKEKPFDYGDPEPTFDDELPSSHYTADDADADLNQALESYKNTVDETDLFLQDIQGEFNENFALTATSPQCSFNLSLLNNSVDVNFCPYADHFNYIGLVIRFCVSLNLIIMIAKV